MNPIWRVMTFALIGAVICIGLGFADDFSATKYFYRVDYLKPVGGNPAIINAIFTRPPNADQAETFLRSELERSVKYSDHKGDIMAYAWVGEDTIILKDGSKFLIRVAKTGKIMREKDYWALQMPASDPAKSKEAIINIQLERNSTGEVRVFGNTNLPNQMELMLDLRNRSIGYFAQDKVNLANGSFTSAWFSNRGKSLPVGTYEVTISSALPSFQPESVRKIIGKDGENLSGKIVKNRLGSKVIEEIFTRSVK
jgi:hypothetical protein